MNFVIELAKFLFGLVKIFIGMVLFIAAICVGQIPD